MKKNENLKKQIGGWMFLIVALVSFTMVGLRIGKKLKKNSVEKQDSLTQLEYPEYYKIKDKTGKIKQIILTKDRKISHEGANKKKDSLKRSLSISGKIRNAYLYLDILVDYNEPMTKYDDFYFRIGKNKGGHIVPKKGEEEQTLSEESEEWQIISKNRIPLSLDNKTTFLYDLSKISYITTRFKKHEKDYTLLNQNLLPQFNSNKQIKISAFISSARKGRVMNEVSIYYECEESTPDCLIEKIK